MTDLTILITTFKKLGIDFAVETFDEVINEESLKYNQIVTIEEGIGFENFHTEFYFRDGVFINFGTWDVK